MAQDFFSVVGGIEIQTDDLSSGINILQGDGPPGSRLVEQDAPIGSIYYRTDAASDSLNVFWKYRDLNNDITDWQLSVSQDYVDFLVKGVSWRDPVIVKDDTVYANLAAAEVAVNTGIIDGVAINDTDRILFTGIVGQPQNVFIVTGIPGGSPLATLVEDNNAVSDGDALLVLDGSVANTQWMYDADTEGSPPGTNPGWRQIGSSSASTELLALRSYVGGTLGDSSPNYSSEDIVTDGDNLTIGVSKLDNAIGTLQFTENFFITDFDSGSFPASTFDVTRALDDLDIELGRQAEQIQVDTGTAPVSVTTILDDTLLVSEATEVKWMLQVKDSGGRRRTFEVHALTDGTTAKHTNYANLRIGGPIGNINFDVDIGGSPLSWIVTLTPAGGAGTLTYTLKRLGFSLLP